jgi:hypothetical protein
VSFFFLAFLPNTTKNIVWYDTLHRLLRYHLPTKRRRAGKSLTAAAIKPKMAKQSAKARGLHPVGRRSKLTLTDYCT